jgi:hypothetical protein
MRRAISSKRLSASMLAHSEQESFQLSLIPCLYSERINSLFFLSIYSIFLKLNVPFIQSEKIVNNQYDAFWIYIISQPILDSHIFILNSFNFYSKFLQCKTYYVVLFFYFFYENRYTFILA